MYCSNCGKNCGTGSNYCPNCGKKLNQNTGTSAPKKTGTWPVWMGLAIVIFVTVGNVLEDRKQLSAPAPVPIVSVLETEPETGIHSMTFDENNPAPLDLVIGLTQPQDEHYPNGMDKQRVVYGENGMISEIITYHPNGQMAQIQSLSNFEGSYNWSRIEAWDEYGNPSFIREETGEGQLWMYYYYENEYDSQNRPIRLRSYNRTGNILTDKQIRYHENGSEESFREYRGPIYEHDYEYEPTGQTYLFYEHVASYDLYGNQISLNVIYEG